MAELKELSKLNGFTLKQVANQAQIPYTTLMSVAKFPVKNWNYKIKAAVAGVFQMEIAEFESAMNGKVLSPFIKWVGGKRQLLPQLIKYVPQSFRTYYEPFIGGGALLLRLAPTVAVINDYNEELTNTWSTVKNNYDELRDHLLFNQNNDSKEYYLNVRSADRDGRIIKMTVSERAARFIYLNKAGYNGLWRVNSKGQNNVRMGVTRL